MKYVVPIMPTSVEEVKSLDLSRYEGADVIEWRADVLPQEDILAMAPVIFETFVGYEILFSLRTPEQGGFLDLSDQDYIELVKSVQTLYQPDYIDVPYYDRQAVFDQFLDFPNLVLSHYDPDGVPENVMAIYSELTALSPRVVRVALTPTTEQEVLDMMNLTRGFKSLHPNQTYMSLALGKIGQVTRLFGDLFGSCWTEVAVGERTSPGQLTLAETRHLLEVLTHSKGEKHD